MITCMSETINFFLSNLQEAKICRTPQEFDHRFMYIAPSSDHSLLTLNLPFYSDSKEA